MSDNLIVLDVIPALSIEGFQATASGLIITGDPIYEQWAAYGQGVLMRAQDALDWNFADWLIWGESHYPDIYTQAIDLTGRSYGYVRNIKSVGKAIPPSRRPDNMPLSIAAAVVSIENIEKQDELLQKASSEGWTRAILRQAVRDLRPPQENEADDRELCLNVIMAAEWRTFSTRGLMAIRRTILAEGGK